MLHRSRDCRIACSHATLWRPYSSVGADGCVHAERRLAILDVSEDADRRREDKPVGCGRRLHLRDQAARSFKVYLAGDIGRAVCERGNDGRQVDHCVHALEYVPERPPIRDVAPHELHSPVEAGCTLARPARFEVESHDVVAFYEQRLQCGKADVAHRACQQHLSMCHPRTGFGAASSRREDRNNSSICGLKSARVAALAWPAEPKTLSSASVAVVAPMERHRQATPSMRSSSRAL